MKKWEISRAQWRAVAADTSDCGHRAKRDHGTVSRSDRKRLKISDLIGLRRPAHEAWMRTMHRSLTEGTVTHA
jgi:hypothetical protein